MTLPLLLLLQSLPLLLKVLIKLGQGPFQRAAVPATIMEEEGGHLAQAG